MLVTVRGIGRWTAEMYLMFQLRRLDVWPVDDLGVRQGYGLAWKLDPAPTAKQLEPLGDRFSPYRSIVPATAGKPFRYSGAAAPTRLFARRRSCSRSRTRCLARCMALEGSHCESCERCSATQRYPRSVSPGNRSNPAAGSRPAGRALRSGALPRLPSVAHRLERSGATRPSVQPARAREAGRRPRIAVARSGVNGPSGPTAAGRKAARYRGRSPRRTGPSSADRCPRSGRRPPGPPDLAQHRRVHDQMPEGPDRGHVAGPEQSVRLDVDGQLAPVTTVSVGHPADVHDSVNGPIDDLRRPLVSDQVQRGERKRVELRAGGAIAQIHRQAAAKRRPLRPVSGARAVPTEQPADLPPGRPERAGGTRGAARRVARGDELHQPKKSSRSPGVGNAHTSSSRKSRVSSWIRQGREVCAELGSLIPPSFSCTP